MGRSLLHGDSDHSAERPRAHVNSTHTCTCQAASGHRLDVIHCRDWLSAGAAAYRVCRGAPADSLSPLWGSSLIGWKFLGDRLPLRTKMAVFGALISIGLIFTPTILGGAEEHPRPNRLLGDILAVMTGIGLGSYGNAVRYFAPRHPQMPTQAAQVLSNGTACMISLIVAAASGRPFVFHEPERPADHDAHAA